MGRGVNHPQSLLSEGVFSFKIRVAYNREGLFSWGTGRGVLLSVVYVIASHVLGSHHIKYSSQSLFHNYYLMSVNDVQQTIRKNDFSMHYNLISNRDLVLGCYQIYKKLFKVQIFRLLNQL